MGQQTDRCQGKRSVCFYTGDCLWQDQVQVAELVPEVAMFECCAVGYFEMLDSGDGFQHRQVRGSRLVETGEQSTDGPNAALRCDDLVRPPFARMGYALSVGDSLKRAYDRCSDGDHPSSRRVCQIDCLCCGQRDAIPLLIGRLVILETG